MKNRLIPLLMPLAYSLFFTAAMSALIWITVNYGTFDFVPFCVGLLSVAYSILALAAMVNLLKGNRLFSGSAADVFSVTTQKRIRLSGVVLALPALVFCAATVWTIKAYELTGDARPVEAFSQFELCVFGSSRIWSLIRGEQCCMAAAEPVKPLPVEAEPAADVDFGPYMRDLQRRIRRSWFPPSCSGSLKICTAFKLSANGEVSDVRLTTSSGFELADRAALRAILNGSPYRPLPCGAPESVDVEFNFDYNVLKDGAAVKIDDAHAVRPVQ